MSSSSLRGSDGSKRNLDGHGNLQVTKKIVIKEGVVASKLRLQTDGNLVLQDYNGFALWAVHADGYRFLIDQNGYRLVGQFGTIWYIGATDSSQLSSIHNFGDGGHIGGMGYVPGVGVGGGVAGVGGGDGGFVESVPNAYNRGCVAGDCLGASATMCQTRELYRGQFICHDLKQVGLTPDGTFQYMELDETGKLIEKTVTLRHGYSGARLRLQSDGQLVLADYRGSPIWEAGVNNAYMLIINDDGYHVEDHYGFPVWDGPLDQSDVTYAAFTKDGIDDGESSVQGFSSIIGELVAEGVITLLKSVGML